MTFAQLMDDAKATIAERQACAWHLAQYRMLARSAQGKAGLFAALPAVQGTAPEQL